eukprot:6577551-Pyramimonas_sp.AAC.1
MVQPIAKSASRRPTRRSKRLSDVPAGPRGLQDRSKTARPIRGALREGLRAPIEPPRWPKQG